MNAKLNGTFISSLRVALYDVKSLEDIPGLIKKIIREDLWREFYDEVLDAVVRQDSFKAFVEASPPEGLGMQLETLKKLADDDDARSLIDDTVGKGKTGPKTEDSLFDIVKETQAPDGNSRAYSHRKLKKDRPDLDARVREGELSWNAAMIEAGFRKKMIQIEPTLEGFQRAIAKYLPGYVLLQQ